MGAYNRINGEVACGSETYLRKVLRGEFGFKGYVVSDCGAISDFHEHHKITKDEPESAALAVNSGCDLNCGKSYEWLREAAARGLVSEATITLAVERLFAARYRLGMLGDATVYDRIGYEVVECEAHRELGRAMAREGMVLLKNDGILPLAKGASIAVIGPNADDRSVLLGNYNGTPSRHSTLLRGLQEAAAAGGGSVRYARGCEIGGEEVAPWSEHPEREAVLAARGADLVVMCMGLNPSMEGEEGDAYNGFQCGDKRDLELPVLQQRLYEAVLATGKPIVFVNVSGSCVNLTRQAQTASAILQCFYPGAEGGAALADLLYGAFSPSGKLPVTFYRSVADLPPFEDYSMKGRTYRYFEKEPLYEFGFGLSYSSFSIESPRLEGNVASVHLTNTGGIDAAEVVQLYETWPGTPVSAKTPRRRLIAFRRIFLKAGEEATVSFPASPTEGAVLVANPFKQRE